MIYEALAYKVVVTKRDMYYRNVQLFGKQSVVDTVSLFPFTCDARICITKLPIFQIVDDISCHYNVPRSSLNVVSSSVAV